MTDRTYQYDLDVIARQSEATISRGDNGPVTLALLAIAERLEAVVTELEGAADRDERRIEWLRSPSS